MKKLVIILSLLFFSLSLSSCGGYTSSDYPSSDYKWYVVGTHPGHNKGFDDYNSCMNIAKQLYPIPKCTFEYDRYKKNKEQERETKTSKKKQIWVWTQLIPYKKLGEFYSQSACYQSMANAMRKKLEHFLKKQICV